MSDTISFELGSAADRPPNRFQVNPVNGNSRKSQGADGPGSGSGAGAGAGAGAGEDGPHEVYRRLTNAEGELLEDDTFDATQMLNQRQPRQQRWVSWVWVRGQRAGETALEEITALNILYYKDIIKKKKI